MTTGKELSPQQLKPMTKLPSLADFGLESWRVGDWLPDKAQNVAALEHAREALDAFLVPATDEQFEDEIKTLIEFARAFGIPIKDIEMAADFYAEQLGDLPAAVLHVACERMRGMNWYGRMPTPYTITATIQREYANLHHTRLRIVMALKKHARDRPYGAMRKTIPVISTGGLRAMLDNAVMALNPKIIEDISEAEFEKKRSEFQAAADAESPP